MNKISEYFRATGKAKSCYEPDDNCKVFDRSCINCIRKHLSYPDTCNDGWKRVRGEKHCECNCINYQEIEEYEKIK